ncbi:MAG: hypothetical protein ACRCZ9_12280 [Fusobacteriaceae bacterium]
MILKSKDTILPTSFMYVGGIQRCDNISTVIHILTHAPQIEDLMFKMNIIGVTNTAVRDIYSNYLSNDEDRIPYITKESFFKLLDFVKGAPVIFSGMDLNYNYRNYTTKINTDTIDEKYKFQTIENIDYNKFYEVMYGILNLLHTIRQCVFLSHTDNIHYKNIMYDLVNSLDDSFIYSEPSLGYSWDTMHNIVDDIKDTPNGWRGFIDSIGDSKFILESVAYVTVFYLFDTLLCSAYDETIFLLKNEHGEISIFDDMFFANMDTPNNETFEDTQCQNSYKITCDNSQIEYVHHELMNGSVSDRIQDVCAMLKYMVKDLDVSEGSETYTQLYEIISLCFSWRVAECVLDYIIRG